MYHLSQLQGLLGKRKRRGAGSEHQGDDSDEAERLQLSCPLQLVHSK